MDKFWGNLGSKVVNARKAAQLDWEQVKDYSELELKEALFPSHSSSQKNLYVPLDINYLIDELRKTGVTRKLLWEEYVKFCHSSGDRLPYQYSKFCSLLSQGIEQTKATMYFKHVAGEKVEVDWAGATYHLVDPETGELQKVYFFVATLPYSQFTYVEATLDMKTEAWINAHIHLFNFIQGSPKMIVCDNLKTGVVKHPKQGEVILNASYQEMADYYHCAIIPAKPRTPKGKASVEGSVGKITTEVIARLRHEVFHSLYDLNLRIEALVTDFNQKGFQKRKGSRLEVFLTEEKSYLQPLSQDPYEYGVWKTARVQYNYHISVDKNFYSVPYQYIKKDVRVRITQNKIEIYFNHQRITSHRRRYGYPGQYVTIEEHMPINHRQAGEWNRQRFVQWAKKIGPYTEKVIVRLLDKYRVEQQAYKGCLSLLKLTDSYTEAELEATCQQALNIIETPTYKNIKRIIQVRQCAKEDNHPDSTSNSDDSTHAYIRGGNYYREKD
ncbi:IS21 family transposase [Atopobacter sp. AH10]|uniref:IS21 family transposase n=1 Tax=Atopobacter sp. AH10 TaxID=2315861 RepID=UPI000EF225B8|nr:IS21 family transposase [Atopobacter sp. AH10]RLK62418.1 IS21 family transposase [Atopobacter sp. AH10]